MYKNQRQGRCPPNIEIIPLNGNESLCPVRNLAAYIELSCVEEGRLFLNSKSKRPLHKSTLSKVLCDLIEEADPNSMPQTHDTRRVSTSMAWARGLEPEEIAKRAFWRSSSIFIDRYLSKLRQLNCVALNTC